MGSDISSSVLSGLFESDALGCGVDELGGCRLVCYYNGPVLVNLQSSVEESY